MSGVLFSDIDWAGRQVRIEHTFVGGSVGPLVVFLHEGLGSLAMWKDFPARLCAAAGCRGLVYSRPGYGQSTPRAPGETWGVAASGGYVYYTVRSGSVSKVPAGGGTPTPLASGQSEPWAIAVDATSVYWTAGGSNGTIMKLTPK